MNPFSRVENNTFWRQTPLRGPYGKGGFLPLRARPCTIYPFSSADSARAAGCIVPDPIRLTRGGKSDRRRFWSRIRFRSSRRDRADLVGSCEVGSATRIGAETSSKSNPGAPLWGPESHHRHRIERYPPIPTQDDEYGFSREFPGHCGSFATRGEINLCELSIAGKSSDGQRLCVRRLPLAGKSC